MDALRSGERQVAETVDGIRRDHVARYEWAASRLGGQRVVDAACGVGYGSKILADAGCQVRAFDRSAEAIAFAGENYNHEPRVSYSVGHLEDVRWPQNWDAVVCFEALEHIEAPEQALARFREMAPTLVCSVPNEDVTPFRRNTAHVRHYTPEQLEKLLTLNGWDVKEWWHQAGTESEMEPGPDGRTVVVVAERREGPTPVPVALDAPDEILQAHLLNGVVPESVAIVAMGASARSYVAMAAGFGDRSRLADEVWAINAIAGVIHHDRVFHMDDITVQQRRAKLAPDGMVSGFFSWLRKHDEPIYTSRAYADYPATVEYPLEWVINRTGGNYFNNTVPYSIAFAIALGVKRLHVYGVDYGYEDQPWKREKGRACTEWWLGLAAGRGVELFVPGDTTLFDAATNKPGELYGYDTEWVTFEQVGERIDVSREDRDEADIPTASEMEARYNTEVSRT